MKSMKGKEEDLKQLAVRFLTKEEYIKLTMFVEAREYCGETEDESYAEARDKWLYAVVEHIIEGKKDWPMAINWSKKERNNPYPLGPLM